MAGRKKPEAPECEEVTYFVRQGADGPVKIGRTHNLAERLHRLKTGSPHKLTVLGIALGGDAEKDAHARFKAERLSGEWFEPTAEVLAFAAQFAPEKRKRAPRKSPPKTRAVARVAGPLVPGPRGGAMMPKFAPGVSGNPNGRPVIPADVKAACRAYTQEAIATLVKVMQTAPDKGTRARAANSLLDRGWGRPTVHIDASVVTAGVTIDWSKLSAAELDALENILLPVAIPVAPTPAAPVAEVLAVVLESVGDVDDSAPADVPAARPDDGVIGGEG